MTSQLTLYNGALRLLGERRLGSITENREPRRLLDDVWDNNAVRHCLRQGQWNFATRTQSIEYDPGIDPDFGYSRAFVKPDDFVKLISLSNGPYFNTGFNAFADEAGYWFADIDPIYVQYVSDDESYGMNYSLWPDDFVAFVEAYLASKICRRLTSSESKLREIQDELRRCRSDAQTSDATDGPARDFPHGRWSRARMG